jgi:hypothetical protein
MTLDQTDIIFGLVQGPQNCLWLPGRYVLKMILWYYMLRYTCLISSLQHLAATPPSTYIYIQNENYNNDYNSGDYNTRNYTAAEGFRRSVSRDPSSSGKNVVPASY